MAVDKVRARPVSKRFFWKVIQNAKQSIVEKVCKGFYFKNHNTLITTNSFPIFNHFITELNTNIQFSLIDDKENESIEFNNKDKSRQEANNKQNGFQFKLSLPVAIDATGRLFSLNNEKTQGEVGC